MDADDKIAKDYLLLASERFGEDYKVIYGKAEKFGDESGLWLLPDFNLETLSKFNMIFCSAFFRKTSWEKVGGYDENIKLGWEDWDFWISLLKEGGNVYRIDKVCFYYRIKKNSMLKGLGRREEERKELFKYIFKKHIDFFLNYVDGYHAMQQELQRLKDENFRLKNSTLHRIAEDLTIFINKIRSK